jgi:hypothetical protein
VPEDRFDDLFGMYIDLRLRRAMELKIASLSGRRLIESREDEEAIDEEEVDDEMPQAGIPTPRQLAPPSSPKAPPTEAPHQNHPGHPGQQNGYTPPRPKRGRPPGPRPQLPGGSPGQDNNQEGF